MKTTLLLNLFAVLLFACAPVKKVDKNTKEFDKKLVGTWQGSSQYRFITRNWEITRNADGTFASQHHIKVKNINRNSNPTGTWWTKDGKYYQETIGDDGVKEYTYTIENSNHLKLMSTLKEEPEEFTETKLIK